MNSWSPSRALGLQVWLKDSSQEACDKHLFFPAYCFAACLVSGYIFPTQQLVSLSGLRPSTRPVPELATSRTEAASSAAVHGALLPAQGRWPCACLALSLCDYLAVLPLSQWLLLGEKALEASPEL